MNHQYKYIINNDGTLEELQMKAKTFIESVRITNKNKEVVTPFEWKEFVEFFEMAEKIVGKDVIR